MIASRSRRSSARSAGAGAQLDARLPQNVEQAAGPRPPGGGEGPPRELRRGPAELHQDIDVELVALAHRGEMRRPQPVAAHLGAQRLASFERGL